MTQSDFRPSSRYFLIAGTQKTPTGLTIKFDITACCVEKKNTTKVKMGNTASTERGRSGPSKNQTLTVKPPEHWTAQTEAQKFVVVSPQSDISNPSQIRHPNARTKASTMTTKTPMRKRASKVISKELPPAMNHNITTGLPAPESFYFDPSSATQESLPVMDSQDDVVLAQQNNKVGLHKSFKAKATRAKRILKGCWKEQKENFEGCVREKPIVEHQRFQSMSPKMYHRQSSMSNQHIPSFGKAKGPQFIPDIEEEDVPEQNTMSPRQVYLHDEESYMKRMQQQMDPTETPLMTRDERFGVHMYPSSSSVVEESPVAKLFARRGQSDSGMAAVNTKDSEKNEKSRYSCPESIKDAATLLEEKTREPNTVEKDIQRQVDEQIRLQFESKSEEIGRVKRLRESYLQRLESTRRLSQEDESRRQSTQSQLGKAQDNAIEEETTVSSVGNQEVTTTTPFDESNEEAPANPYDEENANVYRGRASAPVEYSTNAVQKTTQLRKSEPVFKSTTNNLSTSNGNLPVLLKIAGWEETTKEKSSRQQHLQQKTEPELPAVLQLAGWKKAANQKKQLGKELPSAHQKGITMSSGIECAQQNSYKLDAQTEGRAIKQADSIDTEQDNQRIPLPYELQAQADNVPKDTPVVKKMSRMLMETQALASAFDRPEQRNQYIGLGSTENLDESMDSAATPFSEASGKPLLTKDALVNAAFLFSPSYVNNEPSLLRMCESKSETTTTISTLDSRNRLAPSYAPKEETRFRLSASQKSVASTKSGNLADSDTSKSSGGKNPEEQQIHRKKNSNKPLSLLRTQSNISSRSADSSDRQVRFSIGNKVIISSAKKEQRASGSSSIGKSPLRSDNLVVPGIENKMSDLTDTFGSERECYAAMENDKDIVRESIEEIPHSDDSPLARELTEEPSPPSHWSYSTDMDNGVTPLRSGKGSAPSNATNSPHKRFNEAKNRFSVAKTSPVKKRSPVKPRPSKARQSGGLVQSRIVAMEQQCQNASLIAPKPRRDTIGHKVIAPRRATLKSPHFKAPIFREGLNEKKSSLDSVPEKKQESQSGTEPALPKLDQHPKQLNEIKISNSFMGAKKMFENGFKAAKAGGENEVNAPKSYDCENSDSDSDDFGIIRQNSTLEEGANKHAKQIVKNLVKVHSRVTDSSQTSSSTDFDEEDDFAAILQYQTTFDEDDSVGQETVSTLQRNRLSAGSSTVMSGGTAPTVVRRLSIGDHSNMSGDTAPTVVRRSSILSGSTAPTVVRKENSYPPRGKLPFRQEALVRPTEQAHRAAPGTLVLSPMQRTPMQALKWRALAAAEQEKSQRNRGPAVGNGKRPMLRKSLAERNTNVVGH